MDNNQLEMILKQALNSSDQTIAGTLSQRIILAIEREKRNNAIIQIVVFGIITILLVGFGFLFGRTEGQAIISSDVGQLLSLLFSDFGTVIGFWREYLMSLAGALPIISIAIMGALIWSVCISIYKVVKNSLNLIHGATRHA